MGYTFLDEYMEGIRPKVAEIDVFLKTAQFPVGACCVARALSLCEEEVRAIMANLGIESVMHHDFLQIMHKGSSRICGIYRRELETNSPITYECEDIAYIYNLDINDVKNAFQNLKIHEVTAVTMPLVFAKIPY